MQPHPEWNLRVYAVWVPVVETGDHVGERCPAVMPDPRVTHLFDRGAACSHWWQDNILTGWDRVEGKPLFHQGLIWDAFFLYGPEASDYRADCLALGATVVIERAMLLDGLARLFPEMRQ